MSQSIHVLSVHSVKAIRKKNNFDACKQWNCGRLFMFNCPDFIQTQQQQLCNAFKSYLMKYKAKIKLQSLIVLIVIKLMKNYSL